MKRFDVGSNEVVDFDFVLVVAIPFVGIESVCLCEVDGKMDNESGAILHLIPFVRVLII